jgi:uncharacterized protein YjaZ
MLLGPDEPVTEPRIVMCRAPVLFPLVRVAWMLAMLCAVAVPSHAQDTSRAPVLNRDPAAAVISTADIDRFWHAFDKWKSQTGSAADQLAGVLQRDYLDSASQGVRDFIPNRIISADALAKRIFQDPAYYEQVRAHTEQMQHYVPELRQDFVRLKAMYPDAVFPTVYFVIGRRNSGGTDSKNGLIIGAEMFADTSSRIHLSDVVSIVVHELVHYQQQTHGTDLTTAVMNEGAADFISEVITGHNIDEDAKAYGDSHEEDLWHAFQADIQSNDLKPWLYNSAATNRVGPPDLGYYEGYKICQSFYELLTDKAAALRAIIAMRDPAHLIEQSGYARRFR